MRDLTHLSLFTGFGGLDIAAEWAGFRIVGQCEFAGYPTKVLQKHWPNVPRRRDIHTLTRESFYEQTNRQTVDLISGGFPCQPFSNAGKRRGTGDDRYLWPEMLRVIRELRPHWVLGENVAGFVNMALDHALFDLENEGYATRAFVLPACGVNAPHQRYRVAIVAYADSTGCKKFDFSGISDITEYNHRGSNAAGLCNATGEGLQDGTGEQMGRQEAESQPKRSDCGNGNVSYSNNRGRSLRWEREFQATATTERYWGDIRGRAAEHVSGEWWSAEPGVGRVAYGVPDRVERLKGLGNAAVPAQFYPIFKAIAEIERGSHG